jgi:hypothetical protein
MNMRPRTILASIALLLAFFSILASCDNKSDPIPTNSPGWQTTSDMYNAADYTWVDISSSNQLVGNWSGAKIIDKPAVAGVYPAFQLMTIIKLIHVDSASTLYVFKEDQYFNQAVKTEADWTNVKGYLEGISTGSLLNTNYPLISDTGSNVFYGTASATPGVRFEKQYTQAGVPSFVTSLSMKVSSDGTKLLLKYSNDIQFVLGK